MFMDGMIYAAVAQNLADGIGTFWAPIYQPSAVEPYSEQLPMFTGMESLLFKLFGGTPWTERIFMALAWLATAWGISILQRRWWPEKTKGLNLWIVAIWSSVPLVGWGMGNNIQEMWMAPFTLFAVSAMSNYKWAWAGGVLTIGSALFKGPQGLFPFAWIPILGFVGLIDKRVALRQFGMAISTALIVSAGLWLWDDAREAILRNAGNRLVRTFAQNRDVPALQRFWLMGPMLGQWAIIVASATSFYWLHFKNVRLQFDRKAVAFICLALSASLPLMITSEQRDFYLLPSLSFAALGLGNIVDVENGDRRFNLSRVLGIVGLLGIASLPWRIIERDVELRDSLERVSGRFNARSAFNVTPELRLNHQLAAYAMRQYRWEVDLANTMRHDGFIKRDTASEGLIFMQKERDKVLH